MTIEDTLALHTHMFRHLRAQQDHIILLLAHQHGGGVTQEQIDAQAAILKTHTDALEAATKAAQP